VTTPFFGELDQYLFNRGTHYRLWEKLGAHPCEHEGRQGTHFAVWAPNAERVSVLGDFNRWDESAHRLETVGQTGVWEGFVPAVGAGAIYKYMIHSRHGGYRAEKADPVGFAAEVRPRTASRVVDLDAYRWQDDAWMASRGERHRLDAPISIYEVHLGSFMRVPEEDGRFLTYRELAPRLARYVSELGFTHVELLPVAEHPLDGSWGYQTLGLYAPTSRFGPPEDFMYFVDTLHQAGIGVILDWVPAHFPRDAHGLSFFDGTHLYEHADPREGEHRDWGTLIYNYGRYEVSNYLIANALFWLERYHADGLRVDAVASMIYRDYSREPGQWIPNRYGGNENLEALEFLRHLNAKVYEEHPDVITVAEESTAWPQVSRPTHLGGLGFGFKWDMGWMHDTLRYFARDPIHRKYHHNDLTFRLLYAWQESYVLPLSHDEVVHGKGSLLGKMPGDDWQRFANLRLLLGHQYAQPAKKLLFMGGEFGQRAEWNFDASLDWHLLEHAPHQGVRRWVQDLNTLYRSAPALHAGDADQQGFRWVDCSDWEQSILSWLRLVPGDAAGERAPVVVVFNLTPVVRHEYRLGVPRAGRWVERLNSDAACYGGSDVGNLGGVETEPIPFHGFEQSLRLTLPPLGVLFLQPYSE